MSCQVDHFTMMEQLGQLSIFDVLNNSQHRFSVGDDVRVTITLESDYEAYIYFEAYFPEVLKKTGKIVEVLVNNQYLINFAGTKQILKVDEIELKK